MGSLDPEGWDPLRETGWLADHLEDPDIRVVDIRGYVRKTDVGGGRQRAEYVDARDEYDRGHVPGAVFVSWTQDITDPEDPVPAQLAPPERFADLMASLGIGDNTHVVVYDHAGGQFATRLWWALVFYGHDRVSVLNGGFDRWTRENRPTSTDTPRPERATFTPRPRPGWKADARAVLAASGETTLVDARDAGQFSGAVTRGDGKPGHIPGATNLHADLLLGDGGFVPGEEAEGKLREAGVPENRDVPVVAYCNGGVAATVVLFTMYRLGYRNLSNYDGSWNEWGVREDLPAEVQGLGRRVV